MKKLLLLLILSIFIIFTIAAISWPEAPAQDPASIYRQDPENMQDVQELKGLHEPSPSTDPNNNIENGPKINSDSPTSDPMSFMGDVLIDSHVANAVYKKGTSYIFDDVKEVLKNSQFSMVNLENPFSYNGKKAENKQFTFRGNPSHLQVLSDGRINAVTLANNHILDFGIEAMLDTMELLKEKNILFAGAGKDFEQANSAVYTTINGVRLGILASSHVIPEVSWNAGNQKPGVATTYDPTKLLLEIGKAREKSDLVIVYLHWGEELSTTPLPYQKNLARMYIDKGADIIIGSHPHVLQGFEYYKGKLIAYSLGNFVFTNFKQDTIILNIKYDDKKNLSAKVIPCEIIEFRPELVKESIKYNQILINLRALSNGVFIDEKGNLSQGTVP